MRIVLAFKRCSPVYRLAYDGWRLDRTGATGGGARRTGHEKNDLFNHLYKTHVIVEIELPFDPILNARCCTVLPFLVSPYANCSFPCYVYYTMPLHPICCTPGFVRLRQVEAEACHAALVLVDRGSAVLLSVVGFAEEHALITDGLFLFAYAAWLWNISPVGSYGDKVSFIPSACFPTWVAPRWSRWMWMLSNSQ